MTLMALQIYRRCIETNFIQVFARKAKMSIVVPAFGIFYYFLAVANILSVSRGFVAESTSAPIQDATNSVWAIIFIFAWCTQFHSHWILANLRKDNKGHVVSEKYAIPHGGLFKFISTPHMFSEILMYVALYGIVPSQTVLLLMLFVTANQVPTALATHKWYKAKFKDYPVKRKAIIPFLL